MTVMYIHLKYEDYKEVERQMKAFDEIKTRHTTEGGFYHESVRIRLDDETIMEFHGPLVGGDAHLEGV